MSRNDGTTAVYVQTNDAGGNRVIAGGARTAAPGAGRIRDRRRRERRPAPALAGIGRAQRRWAASARDERRQPRPERACRVDGRVWSSCGRCRAAALRPRASPSAAASSTCSTPAIRLWRDSVSVTAGSSRSPAPAATSPPAPTRRRWASCLTARRSWSPSGARTRSSSTPSATTARWESPRPRPRPARRPTASPSRTALSSSPRPSGRRRARPRPRPISSRTARRRRSRARSGTVAARSAGPLPQRTAATPSTNFADGAVSRYAVSADGGLVLEDAVAGLAVDGETGLRDEGLSADGRFLYAIDADSRRIFGWSVGDAGALEPIGSWTGPPATVAGLAASRPRAASRGPLREVLGRARPPQRPS